MTSLFPIGFGGFESRLWKLPFSLFKPKEKIEKNDDYEVEMVHAPWDTLPGHVWDMIFRRLPLTDRVHASVVCREWRSALKETVRPVWMLLFSLLPYADNADKISFFDLSENTTGNLKLPKSVDGADIIGASKGWLKFTKGKKSSLQPILLDPISGTKISLPPLSTIIQSSNLKAATSLDQIEISFKDASEFVVAATFDDGKILALCKPKDNNKWTIFEGLDDKYCFDRIFFCDGILYALVDTELEEDTFEFQTHSLKLLGENGFDVILKFIPLASFQDIGPQIDLEHPIEDVNFFVKNFFPIPYMVESNGELLIVLKIIEVSAAFDDESDDTDDLPPPPPLVSCFRVERFEVFKVETSDTVLNVRRLNSLDDRTLFIDGEDSLFINADESFSKNCIYFLEDAAAHNASRWKSNIISRESGVFHLDDGRIERLFPDLGKRFDCNQWFFPHIKIGRID